MHPTGKFLYAANSAPSSSNVSAFTINSTTGALVPVVGSPFAAGGTGTGALTAVLAVDPAGRFLYVSNLGSGTVSAFTIDALTGALTTVTGSPFAMGSPPTGVAVDPAGKFLYVSSLIGGVSAFTLNATTGAITAVVGSPYVSPPGTGPVVHPSGKFLYVAGVFGVSAFGINPTTGGLTAVVGSPFAAGASPFAAAVDPAGKFLYVTNAGLGLPPPGSDSVSAFTINPTTGGLAPVTGSPFTAGMTPFGAAVDPAGKFLYVANGDAFSVSAFTINGSTGALATVGAFAAGTQPFGVAVTPLTTLPCGHHLVHGHISTVPATHSGTSAQHHGTHGHTVPAGADCPPHAPGHTPGLTAEPEVGFFAPPN